MRLLDNPIDLLPALIERNAFVTLVSVRETCAEISQLPLMAERRDDGSWDLLGHFARSNPQWRDLDGSVANALIHGPHAYISPRWYPEPERSVPTWNYVSLKVTGTIELLDEPQAVLSLVDRLSEQFERHAAQPWRRVDPSLASMATGIVGFRLHVSRCDARLKLNQHQSDFKLAGAIEGLRATQETGSRELADWMQAVLDGRRRAA